MQGHAHADGDALRPRFLSEDSLGRAGGAHGIGGPLEHSEDAVPLASGSDHCSTVGIDGGRNQ